MGSILTHTIGWKHISDFLLPEHIIDFLPWLADISLFFITNKVSCTLIWLRSTKSRRSAVVAEVKASTQELLFFFLMLDLIAMLKVTGAWWSGVRLQANQ